MARNANEFYETMRSEISDRVANNTPFVEPDAREKIVDWYLDEIAKFIANEAWLKLPYNSEEK